MNFLFPKARDRRPTFSTPPRHHQCAHREVGACPSCHNPSLRVRMDSREVLSQAPLDPQRPARVSRHG